jgi:hypothetical protein
MAEAGLPNPEELEELKGKTFTKRVALSTAIFAVILAIASLGGNNAMKHMLLAQQQASDQWAFYQAKSIREHQYRAQKLRLDAELAEPAPAKKSLSRQKFEELRTTFGEEEKRYNAEKKDIEKEAKRLEQVRDLNHSKDPYFDYAEVLLQIAIVLASISILSGVRSVFLFAVVLACLGALLTLDGYTLAVPIPLLGGSH